MHLLTVDPARGCWNVFEALRITTHSGSNSGCVFTRLGVLLVMYTDDVSVSNHNVAPFSYHNNFTCASTANTLWSLTAFAWCKYDCLKDHNNSKVFLPFKKNSSTKQHTETNSTWCVPWCMLLSVELRLLRQYTDDTRQRTAAQHNTTVTADTLLHIMDIIHYYYRNALEMSQGTFGKGVTTNGTISRVETTNWSVICHVSAKPVT